MEKKYLMYLRDFGRERATVYLIDLEVYSRFR